MSQVKSNQVFRKPSCPWGKKVIALLDKKQVPYQDTVFDSKQHEEDFKAEQGVKTTPQVFFVGKRIGGYDELAEYYGEAGDADSDDSSYLPVAAVFATTALMAFATHSDFMGFMGYSLALLACLKLMDLSAFVDGFSQYDLVTKRVPAYGYVYPFAELIVGLGVLASMLPYAVGALSTFVGVVGGVSVFKAVYIDKTDVNCACVGGNSNVPLGAISFTENAMMALMGLWLLIG